ncbi:hypothetical protein [Rhizobium glycinendophyticum]|uniref:DUF3618 domain-containing protein n=1 Tax=Rhizobium glycinendophyticum TaxID=2589807 RepID=A0A504UA48_9HYPH|nr:hypothetical protein [Rhizobium glycinendophyticum]TPP10160.1 hypothetical protein FJQ55_04625 [Rhizobium glycinendophyticum]
MATSNLQAELRELREQMNDLKTVISRETSRGTSRIRHRAVDAFDGAADTASAMAGYARDGADAVASVVRRHPGATSAGLITLGILGGLIGYLVANSAPAARDHRWRWN